MVCPNHLCLDGQGNNCTKCLDGKIFNCVKKKCIHGSILKSLIGTIEALFWKIKKVYRNLDVVICCSEYLKTRLDTYKLLAPKTVVLHNFVDVDNNLNLEKKDYILYVGRYSQEKGIRTFLQVCKELPNISFVFAGKGPLENEVESVQNVVNLGFKTSEEIKELMKQAQFTVCPSECYENCPFTVMESQMCGTPVIGANIGGISELILGGKTGELFESGNKEELKGKVIKLWENRDLLKTYAKNCQDCSFDNITSYYEKLLKFYC